MYYIDSNIFIFALVNTGREGEAARKFLSRLSAGEQAATSYLTVDEVVWKVKKFRGPEAAVEAGRTLLAMPNLFFISVDEEVMGEAMNVMAANKLDPRDAVHLASMKKRGITQIVSTDAHFDVVSGIRRVPLK